MEDPVKHLLKISALGVTLLLWLVVMPVSTNAQMSKVKTVWVILMENHNWTGNNAGAAFGAPDIKGNPLAPYTNRTLLQTSAHAEQYFNPPGNHPSQPNYLWLEAGTNFGVLGDTQPGQPQIFTDQHLVKLLEDAGISWRAYAEPDFGSPVFDNCPIVEYGATPQWSGQKRPTVVRSKPANGCGPGLKMFYPVVRILGKPNRST